MSKFNLWFCVLRAFNVIAGALGVQLNEWSRRVQISLFVGLKARTCYLEEFEWLLKLRKNNWDSDTYEFDKVLTEFASQKRVYEVVAKPVVEIVLDGYNGTVMAYGQTRTGKTFTLGRIGEEDTSDRGIMVRSMEDIFADISPETDSISVSYLQLYMETLQDLLDPANDSIPIVEDP
nr:kinesin-like protein kin-ub [Quercus suber]POE68217.1 kinesin-like protein kin-ub [Quercus suber]